MKTNKLLKVLSAATIISTLAVVDYSTTAQNNNKVLLAADTQNPEVEVPTTALNAYEAGKISMAKASIVKLTVQKVSNGYKYKLILKDIKVGTLSDGVSKLWIEGKEIPLQSIEYTEDPTVINPKLAEFTLSELKPQINATVFVKIMEDFGMASGNAGQGTKDTILSLDLTGVQEKLTPKATESSTKPTTSSQPSTPAKPAETKPVPKPETPKNVQPSNKPTEPTNTKPAETPKPAPTTPVETKPSSSASATYYNGVTATLLNAHRPGQKSMGDAALENSNVTVFKEGSTYHYIIRFHDLSTHGFTGGISKFWVNGTEYAVNPTGGGSNQVEVHFTSSQKLSSVPVSVFVQAMEEIMPGGGKQDATLAFDWSSVSEQQGQPIAGGTPGSSGYTPQPSKSGKTPAKKETPTSPIKSVANPNLPAQDQAQGQGEEKTVTYFDNVSATLLNAYEAGRASMGNAALDGITVYKDGSTYHYIVRFHDIKVGTLTDGITRFWVNGTEYPVTSTGGAMNQVQVHFTSGEQLTNIPVSVFVPTMESIMPGAGKKDAILSLDWSNASERQGTAFVDGGQPGSSANGNRALTPRGGRLNNGRLSNTGLETSSSILAGALTLISAVLVGRRKQK